MVSKQAEKSAILLFYFGLVLWMVLVGVLMLLVLCATYFGRVKGL